MSKYLEKAKEIRAIEVPHHNCCQTVIEAFADECGISMEMAMKLGAHFGSGMRQGAMCGATTGGLIVLGLLGADNDKMRSYMKAMSDAHAGLMDCKDLLRVAAEKKIEQHEHCNGMVFESIEKVAEVMDLK